MQKPKVLVIVGPTATGKSDLAVRLAKKFKGEVISADSRQVYKGLNVGTGKITKSEMKGVRHHLLNVADPKKQFSVSHYKKLADKALKEIISRGKLPIIVGGTGFYIDALTGRSGFAEVPANKKLREKLGKKTAGSLFALLQKKDFDRAKTVDPHNKVRLIRALEIVNALGAVPKISKTDSPYEFVYIGLTLPKEALDKKIYNRLLQRIPGMIREVKRLHAQGLSYKRMDELGLEYRYLARLLRNAITREQFVTQLFSEIMKYAKRQMTWFKRNKEIHWFTPPLSTSDVATIRTLLAKSTQG
jgi:tRNA dimethylallyltransferase